MQLCDHTLLSTIRSLNDSSTPHEVINVILRRSEATVYATEQLLGLKRGTLERQTRSRVEKTVKAAKKL